MSAAEGPRNVLGGELAVCCTDPLTGWYRDGSCRTEGGDLGLHVVCAQVTAEFLAFTAEHRDSSLAQYQVIAVFEQIAEDRRR